MQQDMHFYGVGFLAMAAGLSKDDAFTIAYASQYVDDSIESSPMNCGDFMFDPVRTAHNGLGAVKWTVQRKIHMPFHFLPKGPLTSKPDAFVTVPNSPLAKQVIGRALTEDDHTDRMIALGIAMHTYADTWAHSGFVGKEDARNDVSGIQYHEGAGWIHPIAENVILDLLPRIGHAQAGHYPDLPWLRWKYKHDPTGKMKQRRNFELFLDAAENIHAQFSGMTEATGNKLSWDQIRADIADTIAIADPRLEIRIRGWKETFHKHFGLVQNFTYHHLIWRNEAFDQRYQGKTDWDTMTHDDFMAIVFNPKKDFWTSRWVKFHRMALKQRHFVLEQLF
jgi:hypothetical protein